MLHIQYYLNLAIISAFLCSCGSNSDLKYNAKKISNSPIIDGIMDNVWQSVRCEKIDKVVWGKLYLNDSLDLSSNFKVLWSKEHLYLFIQVIDDVKYRHKIPGVEFSEFEAPEWRPNESDCIEVYFDINSEKNRELGHGFLYRFVYDHDSISGSYPSSKGVEFKQVETSIGYDIEIKIPFRNLNNLRKKTMGFDIYVIDNDKKEIEPGVYGDRESIIKWSEKGRIETYSRWTVGYGNLILSETK